MLGAELAAADDGAADDDGAAAVVARLVTPAAPDDDEDDPAAPAAMPMTTRAPRAISAVSALCCAGQDLWGDGGPCDGAAALCGCPCPGGG